MFLFPLGVDVPMQRIPWMNWLLMIAMVSGFIVQQLAPNATLPFVLGIGTIQIDQQFVYGVLTPVYLSESPLAWFGHIFLHLDFLHLFGNLLFMWIFGNAVCGRIGNAIYPVVFLGLGVVAAVVHRLTIDAALIGASGAINGIVGFYLLLYPVNSISIFYFVFVRFGRFSLASVWMILLWFAFDVLGFFSEGGGIAYGAHVGGFLGGCGLAWLLIRFHYLEPKDDERFLTDVLRGSVADDLRHFEDTPAQEILDRKLLVQKGDGRRIESPVADFLRMETLGKDVDHFVVSEDGRNWITFGDWRRKHGT